MSPAKMSIAFFAMEFAVVFVNLGKLAGHGSFSLEATVFMGGDAAVVGSQAYSC